LNQKIAAVAAIFILKFAEDQSVLTNVRMQRAQRTFWTFCPFSTTEIVWRLGRNVRRVALFDQGRL
jgi:hypothetical protein